MARIASIPVDKFSPEQKQMFEAITGGARSRLRPASEFLNSEGGVGGPFHVWMHAPVLGHPAQELGARVRFDGILRGDLREIGILVVAARTRAEYEWWAHARIGLKEGLDDKALSVIKKNHPWEDNKPDSSDFADADQLAVYLFALELTQTHHVSDKTYARLVDQLGDQAVVELVITIGYYVMVSMTLNVFDIALPEGEKPTFST